MDMQHSSSPSQDEPQGPTYIHQFKQDWSKLCPASSLAAVDSPAAYLKALYEFAQALETANEENQKQHIKLDQRRPDIKTLPLNDHSLTTVIPQLSIVNETLSHRIGTYLRSPAGEKNHSDATETALGSQRFPFSLPFDLAHRQCWLSLTSGKPKLGELSYRISLKLPFNQNAKNVYGLVKQEAYEAQRLLSGLSPAQQALLTEPFIAQPGKELSAVFFERHYGADEKSLRDLQHWLQRTELSSDQTEALLACGRYVPALSANVAAAALPTPPAPLEFHHGAGYINGPKTMGNETRVSIEPGESGETELTNTTWNRFGRLHRMVRLQRWLQLSFDQLDTLLVSVARSEKEYDPQFALNDNTLRALGVYRYLGNRHGLQPEEFAAILDQIPVWAPGTRMSLYDQVFNHTPSAGQPLRVDKQDLVLTEEFPDALRYRLCASLNLKDSPDSLHWLIEQARLYLPSTCPTLTVYSALYRQARIARLFGLSVIDSYFLADLLGGATFTAQLVKPHLRKSGVNAPADLLDILMQMDWLVGWLKESQQTVEQLRRQLVLSAHAQPAHAEEYLNQLNELVNLTRSGLLEQTDIDQLSLPQPEPDPEKPTPSVNWHEIIVQGFLISHPLLKFPAPTELPKGLVQLIDKQILSQDPAKNKILNDTAKRAITQTLGVFYQQLQPWRDKLDALFIPTPPLSLDPALSLQARKQSARQLARAAATNADTAELKHLLLILPEAEIFLGLPVSRETLQAFMFNPEWLSNEQRTGATLKLTPNTLHLLQRFQHCLNAYDLTPGTLLAHLLAANTQPTNTTLNLQLAALLKWTVGEIEHLVKILPDKHVKSVAELDWIMRCHDIAKITGLSAVALLKATDLPATFINDDWKQVGTALIAAAP